MNLGSTELLLILLIGLPMLLVQIWAIVDLLRRPSWAFEIAGVNRTVWLVLMIVGIFACNAGFFVAVAYFFLGAPQLKRAVQQGERSIGFPGRDL